MKSDSHLGKVFNRLTVLSEAGRSSSGARLFACRCECGSEIVCRLDNLVSGNTKSCGCLRSSANRSRGQETAQKIKEKLTTHGESRSRTYATWVNIKTRCYNEKSPSYKFYGARGIVVCERWRDSFDAFLADMGKVPDGMTIERINTNGNYEPGNCVWASAEAQAQNRRSTRLNMFSAKEIKALSAAGESTSSIAVKFGVHRKTVHSIVNGRTWRNAS